LIELEPPSTLPRGWNTWRPFSPGSGSVWYIQLTDFSLNSFP